MIERFSATVGLYRADKYGVHDLLGNIQEVVADCYVDGKQRFPQGGGPVIQENCTSRIPKGSSWHWGIPDLDRRGELPDDFVAAIEGFRLVLDTQGIALPAQKGSRAFVDGLTKAQKQAKIVHAQIADYPNQVTQLSLKEDGRQITLTWQHDTNIIGTTYKVTRQDLISNEEQVLAQGVTELTFVDKKPSKYKARYKVTAQLGEREGLASNKVDSSVALTHSLPTRIQAEAFSKGEHVEVRTSLQEPKHDLVFANMGNTSADYLIEVNKAGKYTIQPRVFHRGVKQSFAIMLNDKLLKTITTKGDNGWQTAKVTSVTLPKGKHTLTVKPIGERTRLSINWLDIKKL